MTMNEFVALSGGIPSSTTDTEIVLVVWAWLRAGAQLRMPVNLLIRAPLGASRMPKVKWLVGMSGSMTMFVTFRGKSTSAVSVAKGRKTGGLFPLMMAILKIRVAVRLGDAFSLTMTLTVFVTGAGTSGSNQVNKPLV